MVIQVTDGDTIKVRLEDGDYNVRYIGIDTPEINDRLGNEARNENSKLVAWQTITLVKDVSETDRYDRLLRYVFVGDIFVNYELVQLGYAEAKDYPPDTACSDTFHQAESSAKAAKAGIWKPTPTPYPTAVLAPTSAAVPAPAATSPPSSSSPPVAGCSCTPPDLDCADFGTHSKAQACYEYCKSIGKGDYYRLDGDDDGSACESLP